MASAYRSFLLDLGWRSVSRYYYMAKLVAVVHMGIILLNAAAIPFLIWKEPFWIWMPLITMLGSPVLGGTYCMFNRLENHYRRKAGMPQIEDRFAEFLRRD